jgi:DNA-binding NarL/FixJ family response regulator
MQPLDVGGPPGGSSALLRACIVDEHAGVREWLTGKLDSLGIETAAASETVAAGVEQIRTHRPDLVVVDNRLPDGRGVDLCREVSGLLPETTFILHTGVISPLEASQAYDAGVTRIALKTIQGEELLAAVSEFASRRRGADRGR